jgi:methyl-accepting chemotaxis protein
MSTTASAEATVSTPPPDGGARPRYKRSLKNYLIDSRFQFKWTGIIVFWALLISVLLGIFLLRTSSDVVTQGKLAVEESRKVSEVVKMSVEFMDDPVLKDSFNKESAKTDHAYKEQLEKLERGQRTMIYSLIGLLSLLVVAMSVMGIVMTHRIAGPVYMMKMLLRQVGNGKLNFNRKPRKGDELQEFFEEFQTMANKLKARQQGEVDALGEAIEAATASGASPDTITKITAVRDEMKAALDV